MTNAQEIVDRACRLNAEERACVDISTDALESRIVKQAMQAMFVMETIQNGRYLEIHQKIQNIIDDIRNDDVANLELDHVDLVAKLNEILGSDDAV